MEWLKFYYHNWLQGSSRYMSIEERAVWVDLLALAADTKLRDGALRYDVEMPYEREFICSRLRIDREVLDRCLLVYQHDMNSDDGLPRVQIWPDGTIFLTKFAQMQLASPKQRGREAAQKRQASLGNVIEGTTRSINSLTLEVQRLRKKVRYLEGPNGGVVDATTGEVVEKKVGATPTPVPESPATMEIPRKDGKPTREHLERLIESVAATPQEVREGLEKVDKGMRLINVGGKVIDCLTGRFNNGKL